MAEKNRFSDSTGGKDFDKYANRLFSDVGKKHIQSVGLPNGSAQDEETDTSLRKMKLPYGEDAPSPSTVVRFKGKENRIEEELVDIVKKPKKSKKANRTSMFAVKPMYKPNLDAYSDDSDSEAELLHFCVDHMQFCSPGECDYVEKDHDSPTGTLSDKNTSKAKRKEYAKSILNDYRPPPDPAEEMFRKETDFGMFVSSSEISSSKEECKSSTSTHSGTETLDDGILSPRLVIVESVLDDDSRDASTEPLILMEDDKHTNKKVSWDSDDVESIAKGKKAEDETINLIVINDDTNNNDRTENKNNADKDESKLKSGGKKVHKDKSAKKEKKGAKGKDKENITVLEVLANESGELSDKKDKKEKKKKKDKQEKDKDKNEIKEKDKGEKKSKKDKKGKGEKKDKEKKDKKEHNDKDKKKQKKPDNDACEITVHDQVRDKEEDRKPGSRNDDSSSTDSPVSTYQRFQRRKRLFGDHRRSSSSSLLSDKSSRGCFSDHDLEPFDPQKYKEHLKNMHAYASIIIEDRKNMTAFLDARKEVIIDQVLDIMEPVIARVYELKAEVLKRHADTHDKCTSFMDTKISELQKMKQKSKQLWSGMQLGEDFDDFDKYRDIIYDTADCTQEMESAILKAEELHAGLVYKLKPNPNNEQLKAVKDLGTVNVIEDVSRLPPFMSSNMDEHVTQTLTRVPCTDDNQKNCGFTGLSYVSTEDVVLCDWHHGNIKKVNKLGVVSDRLTFGNSPWDVALVCENKIAVTVPKSETVYLIECEPHLHIIDSFRTDGECFGICRLKTNFAITCAPWSKSSSIKIYTDTGDLVKTIQTSEDDRDTMLFKCPLYIATDFFETILYVTDATEDTVTCLTTSGQVRFVYEHNDLEYPTGLATDRNNNLFVCGKTSASIHKVNNKGELIKILLKKEEDIRSPRAVCFHPYGDFMALTDLSVKNCSAYFKTRSF